MARIAGIDLPDNAKLDWALTRIKGIGWTSSREIIAKTKMGEQKRVHELTAEELALLTSSIDEYLIEGDLVRSVRENVQRLRDIGSYKGIRHARGLPSRGQRTKSNARTRRGKRKTVGSFKKDELTKMQQTTQKAK